ncbi:M42 family metallopeptidase [Sphingomonas bacterium]|uniref:M42 family metallopeptidase n=1 Tax=Sphingomonas bacterium TaxID=1895847 RepID=UPI0015770D96|nr:M42 family metallopeptidase [Sphingomonas bacterium]
MHSIVVLAASLMAAMPVAAQDRPPAPPRDATERLLATLADAPGPSGYEEAVRAIMVRELAPLADQLSYDGVGSVIARAGRSGPRIMLDAHMDELGGMVRRVTPTGFLSMQMLGGWLDQALPDQRWIIIGSKGPVEAVTGIRDVHVVSADERTRVFPRESLYLDVGAKDAAGVAALGLSPGDPVVPDSPFVALPGRRYLGKAWDDRIGCAVLIEALRRLKAEGHPNQLFVAATVQEEIGLRGARTAADLVKPDIGIAIEGGITGDSPGRAPEETQARLGGGPGLFLYDSSTLPNRRMVALVKDAARAGNIPLQLDLVQGYGDDSAAIQATNGGVPTVNLVVPVRYTHAHNGIVDRADFDRTVDLVVALVRRMDSGEVARLRSFDPAG